MCSFKKGNMKRKEHDINRILSSMTTSIISISQVEKRYGLHPLQQDEVTVNMTQYGTKKISNFSSPTDSSIFKNLLKIL